MGRIGVTDFVPPIFNRAVNYFEKRLKQRQKGVVKMAPFDGIPSNVNAKWILDVGANVGDVAVAALKSYPEAQVICFEPVGGTFKSLTQRLEPFNERVLLHNFALSDKEEESEINITTFSGANSISPQAKFHQDCNPHVRELRKEKIQLVCLDDFASNFSSQKIDIMKIDVEGHELNVLKGGLNFISNNVDVIIIEVSLMRDQSWDNQAIFEIFAFLKDAGFCLINIMDLHRAVDSAMMLVQMDCVFRHKRKMSLQ
jgi:FkbM family methyltransferase